MTTTLCPAGCPSLNVTRLSSQGFPAPHVWPAPLSARPTPGSPLRHCLVLSPGGVGTLLWQGGPSLALAPQADLQWGGIWGLWTKLSLRRGNVE